MKKVLKSIKEIIFVVIPKGLNGVSLILFNMILLRFLGKESFGLLSICLTTIIIVDAVLGSSIDLSVLRLVPLYDKENKLYALSIEKAAIYLKLLLFVVAGIILLIFVKPISYSLFHTNEYNHLLLLCLIAGTSMLMLRSSQVHLQVRRKFVQYGSLDLILLSLRFGSLAIILVFFNASITLILLSYMFAIIIALILSLIFFGKDLWRKTIDQLKAFKQITKYAKWFFLTSSLGAIISRMDLYFLGNFASLEEVGIFSGGMTYAIAPELLGAYLAVVFGPRIIRYYKDGIFYSFFVKIQLLIFAIALVVLAAAFIFMPFLSDILLPESFAESRRIFFVLLPGYLANLVLFPLMLSFIMFIKPKFWLTMELVTLPFLVIAYIILIKQYGAYGAALASTISRIFKVGLGQILSLYWARKPVPEQVLVS